MVLFDPIWRSYTSQIYGRSVAPTPFRTVSQGGFSETNIQPCGCLGDWTGAIGKRERTGASIRDPGRLSS
jgi:hypothetical protein